MKYFLARIVSLFFYLRMLCLSGILCKDMLGDFFQSSEYNQAWRGFYEVWEPVTNRHHQTLPVGTPIPDAVARMFIPCLKIDKDEMMAFQVVVKRSDGSWVISEWGGYEPHTRQPFFIVGCERPVPCFLKKVINNLDVCVRKTPFPRKNSIFMDKMLKARSHKRSSASVEDSKQACHEASKKSKQE